MPANYVGDENDLQAGIRPLQWPKLGNHQLPIVINSTPGIIPIPNSLPPTPQLNTPLAGTATGFQFSFNQVTVPAGATNAISSYRVYRNTLNVFNQNLIQTIAHDPTHVGAVTVTDTIIAATGQSYYYWVTSVDTSGQESLPRAAQCGTTAGSVGSTPFSKTNGFAYTSTSTSITWYWDGTNGSTTQTIYRADNTSTGPISGSQAITGLSPSTTYNFYPYYDEASKTLKFVAGGSGSPAYAQPSAGSATLVQAQNLRNQIPFSIGGMQASTPASGSGSGSGGGGGGGGGCFSGNVRVKTSAGIKRFDGLPVEFEITNLTGNHRAQLVIHPDYTDTMIDMGDGELVTAGHAFKHGEVWVAANEFFSDRYRRISEWKGNVYNMHVLSDNPEDHHYILENGHIAHNFNKT